MHLYIYIYIYFYIGLYYIPTHTPIDTVLLTLDLQGFLPTYQIVLQWTPAGCPIIQL
jgi:hypothetical protein